MKKFIKITLIFILVLLTMLCTKAFAVTTTLQPVSVEITAPDAGIYGEGQEITIKCTFDKAIKGKLPNYRISFLGSGEEIKYIEIEAKELTNFSKEVTYKYKIKSGDNGELSLHGINYNAEIIVQDESGNEYYLNGGRTESNRKILADTTIVWTDFSKVKIEPEIETSLGYKKFNLKVENCKFNLDNKYYIHLSHKETEEITIKDAKDVINNSFEEGTKFWQKNIHASDLKESKISGSLIDEIFAETGDVFITICEIDANTNVPKIVLKSKKIDKLATLPLGQRMQAYFFDAETSTFCYEMCSENQQKVNYKIGKITDYNLLKALKDGQYSALQQLMDYAKKADSIGSGTVKLGKDNTITDKLNLVPDGYYYVYMQMDTVDGKYTLIEDVMLYQALVTESVGKNLFSMNDENFKWKLEEPAPAPTPEKQPDTTIADKEIPKAGLENTLIILAIITTVLVIASKKCKKYRDII